MNDLYQKLRSLRNEIAKAQGIEPFKVFHNQTLEEMAAKLPKNLTEMRLINGIGEKKIAMFGQKFLALIQEQVSGPAQNRDNFLLKPKTKPQELFNQTKPAQPRVMTVTEFHQFINKLVEPRQVLVEGEVSNWQAKPNYSLFSLKDETSLVGCFAFKSNLAFELEDGMLVKVLGYPNLHLGGSFRIRVLAVELSGEGAIKKAIEETRRKLEAEGLFRVEHKLALLPFPQKIGVIAGDESAAYFDIIKTLKDRWSGLKIYFYPVYVQGLKAIQEISEALGWFNENLDLDLVILARGGGSLEELQAFNSEAVSRAIFSSRIPIITGVGHEKDVTLGDLVADARASTPSMAAKMAVPDKKEFLEALEKKKEEMPRLILEDIKEKKNLLKEYLYSLERLVRLRFEKFRQLSERLKRAFLRFEEKLQSDKKNLVEQQNQITKRMKFLLEHYEVKLNHYLAVLKNLDPRQILKRGYSITKFQNKIIKSSQDLKEGDLVFTKLSQGDFSSRVTQKS